MNEVSAQAAPRRRTPSLFAMLALLLALLALGLVAWLTWQQRHARADVDARVTQLQTRVEAIGRSENDDLAQQQALAHRMEALENDTHAERDAAQGLDQRLRNLEAALGALSDQQLRGHDMLLLDDAEFLLTAEQQRLNLFDDGQAALRACRLAEQALGHVQDPAFAPARASTANECATLAQSAPQNAQALDALRSLRQQLAQLQPVEAQPRTMVASGGGTWSRLWRALGSVLRIRRDDDAALPVADAGLTRELLQLDLAQAQAALLAGDQQAYRDALANASTLLDARFDPTQPAVKHASSELARLRDAQPATMVTPGDALAVLRGLRASHSLQSIAPPPAPSSDARHKP